MQQVNVIKGQIIQLGNRTVKLDTAFRMVEDKFKHLEKDSDRLYKTVEDLDNNWHKNNLHLKGLKEGLENDNLKGNLEKLLTGTLSSDTDVEVKLYFTYGLGRLDKGKTRKKDRDILLGFPDDPARAL